MKSIVVLLCVVSVAVAVADVEWESFKIKFGRKYKDPAEEALRKKIFLDNKMLIVQHNQLYAEGKSTFTLSVNQFADMTNDEFRAQQKPRVVERPSLNVVELPEPSINAVPTSVDWRDSGCVRDVDDQGECTGTLCMGVAESIQFCTCRKFATIQDLSQQSLIDCCSGPGNTMFTIFQCVVDRGGVASSLSYPSTTCSESLCHLFDATIIASILTYVSIASGSESQLETAVQNSMVATSVDSSSPLFQLYSGGIYDNPACSSTTLTHGVLVVGYGTDPTGVDYWLVENNWTKSWGELGYIRMVRNKGNQCGIATEAAYPIC